MFRTIGLQLGYRYEESPIIVPDGTPRRRTIRKISSPPRVLARARPMWH